MDIKDKIFGEFIGTYVMMTIGLGVGAAAKLQTTAGSFTGGLGIAFVWGVAVMLAVYLNRARCEAHFNPAVSVAMAIAGRTHWRDVPAYIIAQTAGAFGGAFTIYAIYRPMIAAFEAAHGIIRGAPGSEITGELFGNYYHLGIAGNSIHMFTAAGVELVGTFFLIRIILSLSDEKNPGRPPDSFSPVIVGFAVMCAIVLISPITQAGLNPARDLAPRIAAVIFGWGRYAFPDETGGFAVVYIAAPLAGASLAALDSRHPGGILRKNSGKDNA
jgi:glycerol uptake facilitator protein